VRLAKASEDEQSTHHGLDQRRDMNRLVVSEWGVRVEER
jgi:hypothetical protein